MQLLQQQGTKKIAGQFCMAIGEGASSFQCTKPDNAVGTKWRDCRLRRKAVGWYDFRLLQTSLGFVY